MKHWKQSTGCFLAATVLSATAHAQSNPVTATGLGTAASGSGTLVRFVTNVGPIDLQLMDRDAPRTVANFRNYVQSGAYTGSFFHRLVKGFVLQGGGLKWSTAQQPHVGLVPTGAAIANEFSASRSNLRGTVAMAKVDGNPDSATNQWFINLADNAANLDAQNGGFTVFAHVLPTSLTTVVNPIAGMTPINASACTNLGSAVSAMAQVPMPTKPANCESVSADNLVRVISVKELPARFTVADTERVFDFLEAYAPQYLAPASPETAAGSGFVYRYYGSTQTYLGAKDGLLFAMGPATNGEVLAFGTVANWLTQAVSNGY